MEYQMENHKQSISTEQEKSNIDRLMKLNCLKQKIYKQSEKISNAQKEIEQVKVILANARNKIESMKARNTTKWL